MGCWNGRSWAAVSHSSHRAIIGCVALRFCIDGCVSNHIHSIVRHPAVNGGVVARDADDSMYCCLGGGDFVCNWLSWYFMAAVKCHVGMIVVCQMYPFAALSMGVACCCVARPFYTARQFY